MYIRKKILNSIIDGISGRILGKNIPRLLDWRRINRSWGKYRKYPKKRKFKINGNNNWRFNERMRKFRKINPYFKIETRKIVINDQNIDESETRKYIKLVFKNSFGWNQKFKNIDRSF
jgi:hypothetical protein